MATQRLNSSCLFPSRRRLDCDKYVGLRARMVRISYARTLATPRPRHHLVLRAKEGRSLGVIAAATRENQKESYLEEPKGFVDEIRSIAMRMHTREQAKEGQREAKSPLDGPVATWKFTVEGYLRFLVNNKLVYDTLERITHESTLPTYVGFHNTGLERADKLAKDLEWFKEQGHKIPEPMTPGKTYSQYLEDIAEKDPPAFICHFYLIYFSQSAGGRMIGTKVSKSILNNKELEFYKWDGELSGLLKNVRERLNKIAELWTIEEKNHCLEEIEISFKFSQEILGLLLS